MTTNTTKTYDVAVIGGGAVGTNVAYQLCKKGYSVALLDRNNVASGSSSHCSASILICDKTPGEETRMGYASMMITKRLQEECGEDFEFAQRGSLYVCETEDELQAAQDYVRSQRADGYDMHMVDAKELQEREPFLAKDLLGGIWTAPDATVNPFRMCFALADACRRMGADVLSHRRVTGIRRGVDGSVTGVVTDQGDITAKYVINCAGVWARELGQMVGIDLPIYPRKGLMLVSERCFPIAHQLVHEFGYMLSKYENINFTRNVSERVERHNVAFEMEPMDAGNFIMGGHRAFEGMDLREDIEVAAAVAERGIRFLPIIKQISCIRSYCGVRPWTEDHVPYICGVESIPGYYVAAGHEGDGIALSGITGVLMAQLIAGEETQFEMKHFGLDRRKQTR